MLGDDRARRSRRCTRRRSRPPGSARPSRPRSSERREPVDLGAGVVEVVLAWRPRRRPRAGSGAARRRPRPSGCPPRWTGPVGFAETNSRLIFWPASRSLWPYAVPAWATTTRASCAGGGRVQPDVEEARAGDLDRLDPRRAWPSCSASAAASSRGGTPGLLGQLQGERGGVVAVLGVARSLDRRRARQRGRDPAHASAKTARAAARTASASSAGVTEQCYRGRLAHLAAVRPPCRGTRRLHPTPR